MRPAVPGLLAAAGKPYYLVGRYPVLLAAGAPVVVPVRSTFSGRRRDCPPAYSGHHAFALWGPPPDVPGHGVVVAVGLTRQVLAQYFDSVTEAARIDNTVELDATTSRPIGVGVPRAALWSQM